MLSLEGLRKKDKAAIALVFLFPIFGNTINSWYSTLFALLGLLSLSYINEGWSKLNREQKWLFYAIVGFFMAFFVKACLLGWQKAETRALGVEIRFLFFGSFLCMAAVLPRAKHFFVLGLMASMLVIAGQSIYEVGMEGRFRVSGAYNPLRVSAAMLAATFVSVPWLIKRKQNSLAAVTYFLGGGLIVLSQGRLAMLAFLACSMLLILILLSNYRQRIAAIVAVLVLGVGVYSSSETLQNRFSESNVLVEYIKSDQRGSDYPRSPGSWVTHFMMLEASWMLFSEYPILGVGRRHYIDHMQEYASQGKVHNVLASRDLNSPHTLVAEVAVSKGIVGLLSYLTFLVLIFVNAFKLGRSEGIMLGMFGACLCLTGVTEAWWVIKGGFVAFSILGVALFSQREAVV